MVHLISVILTMFFWLLPTILDTKKRGAMVEVHPKVRQYDILKLTFGVLFSLAPLFFKIYFVPTTTSVTLASALFKSAQFGASTISSQFSFFPSAFLS